ncbi:MAG: type I 3-dehydroquinate dehydratase [Phycisphaerae bacterium]
MSLLTAAVCEKTITDFSRYIDKAAHSGAEAIELRLDYLESLTPAATAELVRRAVRHACSKIITTCRDMREDGRNAYQDELRFTALFEAVKAGANFIDMEFANIHKPQAKEVMELADKHGARVIISAHSFSGPFPDLQAQYDTMYEACPQAIIKIAYMPKHINDCFAAVDVLAKRKGDAAILAMGEAGLFTRILAPKIGSFFSFATIGDSVTAPGQVSLKQMIKRYRFEKIDSNTRVYGIIAYPVCHSMSPAIYNKTFRKAGCNAVFLPLAVEGGKQEFNAFLDNLRKRPALGFEGFSVSLPHKVSAFEYAEANGSLTERARRIGASNTLRINPLSADNTDYAGAHIPLKSALEGKKQIKAAVLGAGGVARAVVAALADLSAEITIFNRTVSKAEALAGEFGAKAAPIGDFSGGFDVVVNCTSLGMSPNNLCCPIDTSFIDSSMVVFDTVYNPLETMLLSESKATGAVILDGLEMFAQQAIEQCAFIAGLEMSEALIRKAVRKEMKHKA